MINCITIKDVAERFNEGYLTVHHIGNCTIALWNWKGWNIVKYSACVDEKIFLKKLKSGVH